MKIQIVPPPPPPAPPSITLKDLAPGRVFYRRFHNTLAKAKTAAAIYTTVLGAHPVNLHTGVMTQLSPSTEVVPLNATLHVSEPNTQP